MTVPRAPGLPTSRPPPWKHRRPEEPRAGLQARPSPKPRQAPATPHQFCLCARARVETETALALPGESLRNPDLPSYIPLQHGRTPTDLRTRPTVRPSRARSSARALWVSRRGSVKGWPVPATGAGAAPARQVKVKR
jgi:hypothetical protein